MTTSSKPWGIVLEWDEDGLTCCTWLRIDTGAGRKRVKFVGEAGAQYHIDDVADMPDRIDVIATPRQFS